MQRSHSFSITADPDTSGVSSVAACEGIDGKHDIEQEELKKGPVAEPIRLSKLEDARDLPEAQGHRVR